jgi:hypothetical protein
MRATEARQRAQTPHATGCVRCAHSAQAQITDDSPANPNPAKHVSHYFRSGFFLLYIQQGFFNRVKIE